MVAAPVSVSRGEIWLVALDPTIGREIQKTRPCLVISPDDLNAHVATLLVAPMTTGSRPAPFRVPVKFGGKTGLILPEQTRAVDRVRLVKRQGRVDPATLAEVLRVLRSAFAD